MKVNHLEELDGMRSVVDMSIDRTPGEEIGLTVDHRSHPGYLLLAHEDEQVVEEEYNHIVNNIQDSLFEVVPSKATNYYGTSGTSGISSIISGSSSSSSSTDKNGNGNWKGVERGGGSRQYRYIRYIWAFKIIRQDMWDMWVLGVCGIGYLIRLDVQLPLQLSSGVCRMSRLLFTCFSGYLSWKNRRIEE